MATNPHIDRSNSRKDDRHGRKDGRGEKEERDTQPNPAFQDVADDIGERFREALDELS